MAKKNPYFDSNLEDLKGYIDQLKVRIERVDIMNLKAIIHVENGISEKTPPTVKVLSTVEQQEEAYWKMIEKHAQLLAAYKELLKTNDEPDAKKGKEELARGGKAIPAFMKKAKK